MLDLLLIASMAAVFTVGWFLMRKLDNTLAVIRQEEEAPGASREQPLRIGLSDPLVAGCLAGALEQNAKAGGSVSLFSGTEAELVKSLNARKLDMIFLPENAQVPEMLLDHVEGVLLEHTPVLMQRGDIPIKPVTRGRIPQKIIWTESGLTPEARQLIQYLRRDCSVPEVHTIS